MDSPELEKEFSIRHSKLDRTQDSSSGVDYLLECFRTAREELLIRVKHRDHWLELELLAQGLILAVSQGLDVAGITALKPLPDLLAAAIPIAPIFATLYFVEDSLIGYLGRYIGAITKSEAIMRQRPVQIANWDMSPQLRHYAQHTLPIRLAAQAIAFMVIPTGLAAFGLSQVPVWGPFQRGELIVNFFLLCMIAATGVRSFTFRLQTGREDTSALLISYPAVKDPTLQISQPNDRASHSDVHTSSVILTETRLVVGGVLLLSALVSCLYYFQIRRRRNN
jgi:hypothetical protein